MHVPTVYCVHRKCWITESYFFTSKEWIWASPKLRSTQMLLSVPGWPSRNFNFPVLWITHVKCLMQKYNDYYIRKNNVFTNWKVELYMEELWGDLNNFLKVIFASSDEVGVLLCISVVIAKIFSSLSSTGVFVCEAFPLISCTVKKMRKPKQPCAMMHCTVKLFTVFFAKPIVGKTLTFKTFSYPELQ